MDDGEQPMLETERLILRPFAMSDAKRVQELAGEREIAATTLRIPHPYEDGMAEEWIGTHAEGWREGCAAVFAIVSAENRSLMGAIVLTIDRQHARAELGYWIGKPYWSQGYGTEAAREMLRFGFEDLKLNRVQSTVFPSNPASGKILIKVGMTLEGTLRNYVKKWGRSQDLEMYSILASEYRERIR